MMGALGWPPDAFWNALFTETMLAIEGVAMANGVEPPGDKRERDEAKFAAIREFMKNQG